MDNIEEEEKIEDDEAYEPDPDILKEKIVVAKDTSRHYGKESMKYVFYALVFCAVGIILNGLYNAGTIPLNYTPAEIERIKTIPIIFAFAPLIVSGINLVRFSYYESLFDYYKKNLEKISPLQINLGNEKLIEEIKTIVSPKKIEKVKPPKKLDKHVKDNEIEQERQ